MSEFTKPKEIENESMRIIKEELSLKGFDVSDRPELPLILRAIHTTADFDFAENLEFSKDAVESGRRAICGCGGIAEAENHAEVVQEDNERAGTDGVGIFCDTNMIVAGISKKTAAKYHCPVECLMADPKVAKKAEAEGTTRAYQAMAEGAKRYPDGIFAVGNAPTALIRLKELMEENPRFRPSLIIAVPVGFVNVVESKEALAETCRKLNVPYIVAHGRKGGSTVAVSLVNALLYGIS